MYTVLRTALMTVLLLAGPVAAETVLHLTSDTGDYIGQGNDYTMTLDTHTFHANRNYDNGVSFYLTAGGSDFWHVHVAAPDEAELTTGTYANATRWPFQAAGVPGLSVSGQGRGCNQLIGHYEVLEVVYDAAGNVMQFAADFEQHCEGAQPALTGQIRFHSEVPWHEDEPPVAAPIRLTGLTATASSTYDPWYYSANNLLDDDPYNFWAGGWQQAPWTVTVNLGGLRTLDSIEIDWYYIYGSAHFDIEYTADGLLYLPIATGLSEPGMSSPPYVATHVQSLAGVEASHVQLVIHHAIQPVPLIADVRLFGSMPGL